MGRTLKTKQVEGKTFKLIKVDKGYRVEDPDMPALMNKTFRNKDRAETEFDRLVQQYSSGGRLFDL